MKIPEFYIDDLGLTPQIGGKTFMVPVDRLGGRSARGRGTFHARLEGVDRFARAYPAPFIWRDYAVRLPEYLMMDIVLSDFRLPEDHRLLVEQRKFNARVKKMFEEFRKLCE